MKQSRCWPPGLLRAVVVLGVALALLAGPRVPAALAHAELVRSEPAAGAVLSSAPTQVKLWFSEQIEPLFSQIAVTDTVGARHDLGTTRVAPDDGRKLLVDLEPLGQGTFTVEWRLLSTDGHVTGGVFRFSVGAPSAGGNQPVEQTSNAPYLPEAVLRWLTLAAAALLVGGFTFRQFVLLPAMAVLPEDSSSARLIGQAGRLALVSARWAGLAMIVLGAVALFYQAAQVAGVPFMQALNGQLMSRIVLQTRYGMLWLANMIFLVGLLGILDYLVQQSSVAYALTAAAQPKPREEAERAAGSADRFWWWMGLLLGIGLLLTISLSGHAGGRDPVALAVVNDWLHLLGAVLWLGGLFHTVLLLRLVLTRTQPQQRAELFAALMPPLSRLSVIAVVMLMATGMMSAWLNVVTVPNLVSTGYGRVLLVKQGVLLPMFVLAAISLLVMAPRLNPPSDAAKLRERAANAGVWLAKMLRAEAALGLAVLLVVGVLASSAPATVASNVVEYAAPASSVAPAQTGITLAQGLLEMLVVMQVSPADVGLNTVTVTLKDVSGEPVKDGQVELRVANAGGSQADAVTMLREGDGLVAVAALSSAGQWQLETRVRLPGKSEETAIFSLALPLPGAKQQLVLAEAAMNRLVALKEHQELRGGPGGAGVVTDYLYSAPDAVSYHVDTGAQAIIIGQTRYALSRGRSWEKADMPAELRYRFPAFLYSQGATGVTQLGQEQVDGVECDIVVFHLPASDAYFRIWMGTEDLLIRKLTMMAPGHFMTSTYSDFNVPNSIKPPQ